MQHFFCVWEQKHQSGSVTCSAHSRSTSAEPRGTRKSVEPSASRNKQQRCVRLPFPAPSATSPATYGSPPAHLHRPDRRRGCPRLRALHRAELLLQEAVMVPAGGVLHHQRGGRAGYSLNTQSLVILDV